MPDLYKLRQIILNPKAVGALLTWPKFSVTSYFMVSALRKQGIEPGSVIDVGANVGQFAVASAKLWPGAQVYSFEALPHALALLRKHTVRLPNVTVYPLAVGDEERQQVPFHVNVHSHSSSFLSLADQHLKSFPYAVEEKTIRIDMTTLDSKLGDQPLEKPTLLKIDVQGYEAKVLKGAIKLLKQIDYLLMEVSFKPMYHGEVCFPELLELLEKFSFRFLRPVDWLQDPRTGEVLQMDALFWNERK
ncbi:MAG: FkbM family methyltransferase [Candidatus Marinimicrobia bacterium]|nr:FkbM family methyltransferase [Candidatus Neomarinimicrobiota bacterium]